MGYGPTVSTIRLKIIFAFFKYNNSKLNLLRQQTLSAPVASGITVLKNDKNIVTSLGMILSDNTVAIMFRNDTP